MTNENAPHTDATAATHRTRAVLLGTAGGPVLTGERSGMSTAICYGKRVYIVDLGVGSVSRLITSRLAGSGRGNGFVGLRGVFFSHLHSDHVADWPSLMAIAYAGRMGQPDPIRVFGPGARGVLPALFPPGRPEPDLVGAADPTPGIASMSAHIENLFAADFNDRMRDSGMPHPGWAFDIHDIDHAPFEYGPDGVPPTDMAPFEVWVDGDVRITATLVDHRPTAPALAYRFDTPDGSIVVSGDTAPTPNLIRLARGADVLIHEVIDRAWVEDFASMLPPGMDSNVIEAIKNHLLVSHTTIDQVGGVAEAAEVGHLVLSHIVPPDTTLDRLEAARENFGGGFSVGTDLLAIGVGAPISS